MQARKTAKRVLSLFLTVVMTLCIIPLTGVESSAATISLNRPLNQAYTITAREYYSSGSYHGAIDYGCSKGTPVYAAESGTATVHDGGYGDGYYGCKDGTGWGNYIDISHGNGYSTRYAHMSAGRFVVKTGEKVERGQLIGYSGHSGNSSGPHLHFGLYLNGSKVYPEPYIKTATGYHEGNGPHTCSFSGSYFEAAHPHKVYQKCSCGATKYTGETRAYASCSTCMTKDTRYPTPFKAYNLANAKTPAYDSVSGSSVGYIYATDECTVQEVYKNGWCKVLCPWTGYTNGRVVYALLTTFIASGYTPASTTVSTQTTTYTRKDIATSYGYIGAGDTVTKVGVSGNYTQIIYPLTAGGYKCAWAQLPGSVSTNNSYPVPFKCRVISTSKVKCYNSIGGTSPGYIYPEDDCVITAVYDNGYVQCTCPWSDGTTKTVYVEKSAFINSSMKPVSTTAPKYAKTYLRTDMATNIGWIDAGDSITKVAVSGDKTQIIYPADVGKRCAWVYTSDLTQTYTITYNANGGTGAPSAQTKTHGVNLTLSTTKPTRVGYTFLGWATSASATSAQYTPGGGFSANSNTTLYAVWKANTLSVYYHTNGGEVTSNTYKDVNDFIVKQSDGAKVEQVWTYNNAYTNGLYNASTFGLIKLGYTFNGWGTSASGGTIFDQDDTGLLPAEINTSLKTGNCSSTLYAIWKANTYTVAYNANGGTGTMSSSSHTFDTAKALTANTFTKPGYTFLGWDRDSTATEAEFADGASVMNLTITNGATVTLYAVWKPNTYTVKYNANGGAGSMANSSHTYDTAKALTANTFTRTGYTFLGWSTGATATSAKYTDKASVKNLTATNGGTVTLYAVWKANTYTVAYNANGGTGSMSSSSHTYDTAKALTANAFTRTGYTFLGWSRSATATTATYTNAQSVKNLTATNGATITLYAVWKANTYTVAYNANGGTGSMSSSSHTYDTAKALTANAFTRTGYTFLGWSTSPTATTATYTNAQSVKNLTATNGGTVTLYAVWEKNAPVTVYGDANGDGMIDAGDAVLVSRYDAGEITLTAEQLKACDVNGDGIVDAGDAVLISRYDAGLINSFPVV